MLEELERRNYAPGTIRSYIRTVEHFARHFRRSPDQLGREHIRAYQAAMFTKWKLAPNTVNQRTPSPCPLRRSRWRACSGPHALDLFATIVLSASEGSQPCLSRQVRRRIEVGLPPRQDRVLRQPRATSRTTHLRRVAPAPVSS